MHVVEDPVEMNVASAECKAVVPGRHRSHSHRHPLHMDMPKNLGYKPDDDHCSFESRPPEFISGLAGILQHH